MPKPTSRQMVYSAVKMLTAVQSKIRAMERETVNLKSRMEEIRLVNRAKWILIDRLKMTEPEAHRYIEKQAMDRCVRSPRWRRAFCAPMNKNHLTFVKREEPFP